MTRFFTIITALILSICVIRPLEASGVHYLNVQLGCPYGLIDAVVQRFMESNHNKVTHEIISDERLVLFRNALNKTPPPTNHEFDRIDVFTNPDSPGLTFVYISRFGCVSGESMYYTKHFNRLLKGEVGPFSEPEKDTSA